LNLNYVITIKQDINKLLATRFIQPIEEVAWLPPIVVIPKKNGEFKICVDLKKLNAVTKNFFYPLPFIDVLNIIEGHDVYSFLDGCFGYHQISITLEDKYKTTFVVD
jgi:putative transposase